MGKILLRTFLIGTGLIAGGLAVGYYAASRPRPNPLEADLGAGEETFNPYVKVGADGTITIIAPRAEMGQGVHTTLAALVAEELGVPLSAVSVEQGPTSPAYYNLAVLEQGGPFSELNTSVMAEMTRKATRAFGPLAGLQVTGSSTSTRDAYEKMRHAGAVARTLLFTAAQERLATPAAKLQFEGADIVAPSGRRVGIASIAAEAASLPVPDEIVLKDPADWTVLGKTQQRVDLVEKVTGAAKFGIDVDLPDMLYGTVLMNPKLGGGIETASTSFAEAVPGVVKIVRLETQTGSGFGVIAENTWAAFKAAEALEVQWGDAPYPSNTESIMKVFRDTIDGPWKGSAWRDDGDVDFAFGDAPPDSIFEADYEVPFLAHATMEPMNATARFADGRLTVWAPTQAPTLIQTILADAMGIDSDAVTIHSTYLGGGFGRRAEADFALYAAELAKEAGGRPVNVTWTREEDMTHDVYRPAAAGRFRVRMDVNGMPDAVDMRIATPSILKSIGKRIFPSLPVFGPERLLTEGAFDQPYTIPNYRVAGIEIDMPIPVGFWRSVGYSYNGFFHECFMDEIAERAGRDPIDLRLQLMADYPLAVAVMEKLRDISNWDRPLRTGKAKGVAFTMSFGSWVGEVVQVSKTKGGLSVEKVWAVAEVGRALDPGIVRAQIESGIVFGLSAAIGQEITFSGGKVDQQNFYDFDAMRIDRCPKFEIEILENSQTLGGVGEIGTPPAAPALANAVRSLTGKRIRSLPLSREVEFA